MTGFPTWFEEALTNRLDTVLYEVLQEPQLKMKHQRVLRVMEQLKISLDDPQMTLFMQWDEDVNQVHAWEKEGVYRQGVRDGAQMVFALLYSDSRMSTEVQ